MCADKTTTTEVIAGALKKADKDAANAALFVLIIWTYNIKNNGMNNNNDHNKNNHHDSK